MIKGTVIKSTGSWYHVRIHDEESTVVLCRIIGKFRLDKFKLTNPVAVGDEVGITYENGAKEAIIKTIYPRKNFIIRQSPHKKHDMHLMASNVDQALLITTIVEPNLKPGFIDRFLLLTEPRDIPTIIVFNKSDLIVAEEDKDRLAEMIEIYGKIGYTIVITSTLTNDGIDDLKAIMKNKISLISGHSGVGKSTLVNSMQPHLDLRTGEISNYSGKGQHTTTFAEMHPLDFGGYIIDTPGIKSLAFNNLEEMDVAHNFREFFAHAGECRFGANCMHRNEPKCAIKAGLQDGTINEIRYMNYLQILEEIESQNYWEIHKD